MNKSRTQWNSLNEVPLEVPQVIHATVDGFYLFRRNSDGWHYTFSSDNFSVLSSQIHPSLPVDDSWFEEPMLLVAMDSSSDISSF